jgi:hypothetical protein
MTKSEIRSPKEFRMTNNKVPSSAFRLSARLLFSFLAALLLFPLAGRSEELSRGEIEKRVSLSAPAANERRMDDIGWARDIRDALRLAKENKRPVFLFTHDGRMAAGRC